ncbi:homeodomain-like superfamily protein [Actinidia rufa]|uniref:Homeodomain-like superfamily protein n=1 Tax=Actinidia rufa TaxID=165716 RepID=A0A7J0G125_9ERIC|nr:homeodomain-like superfamily protein [Actinidia rufa]
MTRRCSHCSNNGHNSRTCPWRGGGGNCVKLFGVRLTDGSIIKKSASMGNLSAHYHSSSSAAASPNPSSPSSDPIRDPIHVPDGYLSDDPAHATCSTNRRVERKKGVPWTEEEHRLFLIGLHKSTLSGTVTLLEERGDPAFFDMVPEMGTDQPTVPEDQFMLPPSQAVDSDTINSLPSLKLSLSQEFELMEAPSDEKVEEPKETVTPRSEIPTLVPAFFSAFLPVPFAMWPSNTAPPPEEEQVAETFHHQVLRPTPVIPKEPVNVDQLVGMSQLNLGEAETGHVEPSLSLNLLGAPSRPSAFHASTPANKSDLSEGKSNVIQAV